MQNKREEIKRNTRAVSLDVLERIINNGAYNTVALSDSLERNERLGKNERAFVTELTNGVLRNLTLIDYVISVFSNVPIKKLKPTVMNVLRLSVYEIMFMSTPGYAACNEAVRLVKERGLAGLSGFVNGVLRNVLRNKASINFPDNEKEPGEYLAVFFSHPRWLVDKWLAYYGYKFTGEMLRKNNEPPEVTIRVNTLKTNAPDLARKLSEAGINARESGLLGNALILNGAGSIKALAAYREGLFHVQDLASQIAIAVLAPRKNEQVADLCAAPGGKSFLSAYLMENEGIIYSRDIHENKIRLVEDGAKRLGINIIRAFKGDSSIIDDTLKEKFDRVIIDAPCSGLGIIRKKPDIKLKRAEKDIISLQKIQRDILASGAQYVRKGGSLLYSTCTLTDEENIENANWFTENYSFEKEDFSMLIPESLRKDINNGCLTLYPHIHGTDGFFIAKFKKRG